MNEAARAILAAIKSLETQVETLRAAKRALDGQVNGQRTPPTSKRRPKTNAEKALLSKKLKAAWRRRRAAQGA